jgi:hypothetical protein
MSDSSDDDMSGFISPSSIRPSMRRDVVATLSKCGARDLNVRDPRARLHGEGTLERVYMGSPQSDLERVCRAWDRHDRAQSSRRQRDGSCVVRGQTVRPQGPAGLS